MNFRKLLFCVCIFSVVVSVNIALNKEDAKVISQIPTKQKVVALTFDDGPNPRTTPKILSVLKEKQVKATFFVLGEKVDRFPTVFSQELAAGHEIGNHGYSHTLFTTISTNKLEDELEKTASKIPPTTLLRPPEGKYNKTIKEIAAHHHYTVVLWSIDPQDWSSPPVNTVVETVLTQIKPGSIILMHDGNYPLPTPEALGIIIDRLKERGYEFVTVSELLKYYDNTSIMK